MKEEIEVKFLEIDHDELRKKLVVAGADLKHKMRQMQRAVIDYPDTRLQKGSDAAWAWVRVRDEGDKVTCTYKHISADGHDTAHEIEIIVSSYPDTIAIFEAIGLKVHTEQATRRETWQMDDVEIVLDEWPWVPPFIEIEGPSTDAIRSVAKAIGLDWETAFIGNGDRVYRKYFHKMTEKESISDLSSLTFDGEMPDWLKERR